MGEGLLKDVLKVEKRSKGKATWTAITTLNKEGKEKLDHLIITDDREAQDELSAKFYDADKKPRPGKYKIHYKKVEAEGGKEYWNVRDAEYLGPLNGAAKAAGTEAGPSTSTPAQASGGTPNKLLAIMAASKGAAMIVAARIRAGLYTQAGAEDAIVNDWDTFTALGYEKIVKLSAGKKEEKKTEPAPGEADGA